MKARIPLLLTVAIAFAAPAAAQVKKGGSRRTPTPGASAPEQTATPAKPGTGAAETPAAAAAGPCAAPEYHQFDFWLGDWKVNDAQGKPAGENKITAVVNGCALQENWTSAKGSRGTSLNIYDATARHWHQTWVDDSGGLLLLDGEFRDGKMVLLGRHGAQKDKTTMITHRISWTPEGPDRVRQLWEASSNDGRTWKTVFDGTYIRKK